MRLSAGSALQQQKDYTKFETARKLGFKVEKIRESYRRDMRSEWMKPRQLSTALYFIDRLALRVGTEKDPGDGADTVRFESSFYIPLLLARDLCSSVSCENPFIRSAVALFKSNTSGFIVPSSGWVSTQFSFSILTS